MPKIPASDPKQRRCQRHRIARARRHCQEAIVRFDRFEEALREVQEGLECVDLEDGHLRQAGEVKAMIEQAADSLQVLDPACHQGARYLRNRAAGLSLATGELNTRLGELAMTYTLEAVALACMLWRWVFELQLDALLDAVKAFLDQRHRASSAIEEFNAAPLVPFSMCTRE